MDETATRLSGSCVRHGAFLLLHREHTVPPPPEPPGNRGAGAAVPAGPAAHRLGARLCGQREAVQDRVVSRRPSGSCLVWALQGLRWCLVSQVAWLRASRDAQDTGTISCS